MYVILLNGPRNGKCFNADKCTVLHVRYNNNQAEYVMNDVKLECVSEEKDLGVNKAKFHYAVWSQTGPRLAQTC